MPDPIGSVSHRDVYSYDPDLETGMHDRNLQHVDEQTFGACRAPQSVLGGASCGDDTAISNTCRRSKPGTVDGVLCDDKALHEVQKGLLSIAKEAAKKVIELFLGAKFGK